MDALINKLRRFCQDGGMLLATVFAFTLLWLWSSGLKDAAVWSALLYVIVTAIRRRERIHFGGLGWPLLIYLFVCALSSWNSLQPWKGSGPHAWSGSWRCYFKLIELVAGYIALANILRYGRRAQSAVIALALAFVLAWLCDGVRLGAHTCSGLNFLNDGRWSGSRYGFPTIAAAVHACGFVLCVALLLRARAMRSRVVLFCGLLLCCVLLINFQTRSVFLGLAAGLLLLFASLSEERKRALAAMGFAALLLVGIMLGSPSLRTRFLTGGFSDRLNIWADAALVIKYQPASHHITGYGYGHGIFTTVYGYLPKKYIKTRDKKDHAHNMFLETLIETGWPGLAAWILLLATAARNATRALLRATNPAHRWAIASVSAALVFLVVYGQFSAFFALAPIFLFWNLLGILAALCTCVPGSFAPPPSKNLSF